MAQGAAVYQALCGILRIIRQPLTEIVRASEWWDYKLVPILSTFYATAVLLRVPIVSIWTTAVVILLAMVPGAAYVSVINDLTDQDEDRAAGKRNRLAGRPRSTIVLLIAATAGCGLVFAWRWRGDPLLLWPYLAAWLAFSLYSFPPFRFKSRGILGVLCDASGAHLLPTSVAVILTFRAARSPIDPRWLAAVATWSFAYGLRGILWHQLMDRDADRGAGVHTFAERHDPRVASRLGGWLVFPIELLAFAAMLGLLRSLWPLLFLGVYLLLTTRRMSSWKVHLVVVAPKPRFFIVLHEYYDVFFPLALLVAATARNRWDAIVLTVHLLLFWARPLTALEDSWKLRPSFLRT